MARKLTILLFMAADNDLDSFAVKDLHEAERIGSSEDVALVVQVDRHGGGQDGYPLRGLIVKNPSWNGLDTTTLISPLSPISETNTGDPKVLQDFIVWGARTYPAENYVLIVWSHGNGWRSEFIYESVSNAAPDRVVTAMRSVGFAERFHMKTRRLFFRPTLEKAVQAFVTEKVLPQFQDLRTADASDENLVIRAIGLDDTSGKDALDSIELKSAIESAGREIRSLGQDFNLGIIGFDACLMAGIETAYQIKDLTAFVVGSEEVEPGVGWKYDLVLEAAYRNIVDGGTTKDLAVKLVQTYITGLTRYRIKLITQSAIATSEVTKLVAKLNNVGNELNSLIDGIYGLLARAEKTSTRFFDNEFIDIGHYLDLLGEMLPDGDAKRSVEVALQSYAATVVASQFAFGRESQKPSGLSVYYPTEPRYDSAFDLLEIRPAFDKWVGFIRDYHFLSEQLHVLSGVSALEDTTLDLSGRPKAGLFCISGIVTMVSTNFEQRPDLGLGVKCFSLNDNSAKRRLQLLPLNENVSAALSSAAVSEANYTVCGVLSSHENAMIVHSVASAERFAVIMARLGLF